MNWIKPFIGLLPLLLIGSPLLHAAPFIPKSDQQILETLPTDSPPPRYSNSDSFVDSASTASPEQTSKLLERAYLQGDHVRWVKPERSWIK